MLVILKLYGYKMSSLEQKSIKVIEFTGKDKDWKIWSRKFLA